MPAANRLTILSLVNYSSAAILFFWNRPICNRRKWVAIMGMQCAVTGKKPVKGNHYARRGKAKYLGGVGRKVTGITKRTFKPNLQRIKIVIDGKVQTVRVCVKAIRSGLVQRPIKRKPFQMPNL